MRYNSPAFIQLQDQYTPEQIQDMLNSMSLYKTYITIGVSDKLLLKYINHYNLSYNKSYKKITDITDSEVHKILNEWTTSGIAKRELLKKYNIGSCVLNKILKKHNVANKEKSQIDTEWFKYQKLVIKLTSVIKRHYKLKTPIGFDWDHKFTIRDGYLQNIHPNIIASIENLELIPSNENRSNGEISSITKEQLFKLCKVTLPHIASELP
jgi:hypothetical protein